MILNSVYKIPNGKLLKIKLDYNEKNNSIINLNINGDFFVYPEEAIEYIENKLQNIELDEKILFSKIDSIIKKKKYQFIGIDSLGLTKGIMMCLNE